MTAWMITHFGPATGIVAWFGLAVLAMIVVYYLITKEN